jgi:hypothetical protein
MALGTDKILGPNGAGILDNGGKLTQSARDRFISEVILLQMNGNENGMGISKFNPLLPIPIPPVGGPNVPSLNILGPKTQPLFWFSPDPFALLSQPILNDKKGIYQKIWLDGVYEPLAAALNLSGKTMLGPVIDPTIVIDLSMDKFKGLSLDKLPQIMAEIFIQVALANVPTTAPAAKIKLYADFGIGDPKIPDLISLLTAPPIPAVPSFSLPTPPDIPNPSGMSVNFTFPNVFLELMKAPLIVLPQIVTKISINLDPLGLLKAIFQLLVAILELAYAALQISGAPSLLMATLVVIIKNLAGILLCDAIGSLLGTGLMVKIIANLVGLS